MRSPCFRMSQEDIDSMKINLVIDRSILYTRQCLSETGILEPIIKGRWTNKNHFWVAEVVVIFCLNEFFVQMFHNLL
jgi:hypothetical protein